MAIKYQSVNKKYILNCINPKRGRKRRISQLFKYFKVSRTDDYFEFGIINKGRPELGVLNIDMIDDIRKKYIFCSVSREQFGDALMVICKRDRWNECDYCTRRFWEEKGEESFNYRDMYDYKNKTLCKRCYQQVKKIE